jgi:ATP-dependent Zn protease
VPILIDYAVSWLPALIFIGLSWLLLKRASAQNDMYKAHLADVSALNQEILVNNRRMVAILEEISAELKQRKS